MSNTRRFSGRRSELAKLQALMSEPSRSVCFVHGPGGIGKTTLVAELARRYAPLAVLRLDAEHVGADHDALDRALDGAKHARDALVIIDGLERAAGFERLLIEAIVPALPEGWTLVLTSRNDPDPRWHGPQLDAAFLALPLGPFDADETAEFLAAEGATAPHHAALHELTYGHPLALALCLQVNDLSALLDGGLAAEPELVRALLPHIVSEAPTAGHRAALELCAVSRRVDEALLTGLIGDDRHAVFRWLSERPFMRADRDGLYPHDLVRDVLRADLAWRDPHGLAQRTATAREGWIARLSMRDKRATRELLYLMDGLAQSNRLVYHEQGLAALPSRTASASDLDALAPIIERLDGAEVARWFSFWRERGLQTRIFLNEEGEREGYMCWLQLNALAVPRAEACQDPGIAAAFAFLDDTPHRDDADILFGRFFGHIERGGLDPVMNTRIMLGACGLAVSLPRLGFIMNLNRGPDRWRAIVAGSPVTSMPTELELGGHGFGLIIHDFRVVGLSEFFRDQLATPPPTGLTDVVIAPRIDFNEMVRRALRALGRGQRLEDVPLARTPVALRWRRRTDLDAHQALVALLTDACEVAPMTSRARNALVATFLRGAVKQLAAAGEVGLSFGTYRRALAQGLDAVVEYLWSRERAIPMRRP